MRILHNKALLFKDSKLTFVDGLQEDQLKLKVLRANPKTLDVALTTATNE